MHRDASTEASMSLSGCGEISCLNSSHQSSNPTRGPVCARNHFISTSSCAISVSLDFPRCSFTVSSAPPYLIL
ncbi:unnamed protein product [Gadus morhua 'NCC']